MHIDKVTISETHEIVLGEKTLRWQKIEASVVLELGESSMKGANYVQDFINEWNKRPQHVNQQAVANLDSVIQEDDETTKQFNELKQKIEQAETKQQAYDILNQHNDWKFNLDLKKIINKKP